MRKKGFVVSAVLYPLLVIALALIMSILSMSDNRRKILENMKLEILEEENETESNMSNSELYFKLKALEESVEELNSRISEDRLEELENNLKSDYEKKINDAKTGVKELETTLKSDYEKKINDAKKNAKLESFPVGSIFVSTKNTNPSTYIGGTWVEYGQGKALVGVNTSETEFNTVEKTGGEKAHKLTVSEIPSHTHTFTGSSATTSETGAHTHTLSATADSAGNHYHKTGARGVYGANTSSGIWAAYSYGSEGVPGTWPTSSAGAHTHTVTGTAISNGNHTHIVTANGSNSNTGGDTAHNNLQPYITVYFFKRTA